MKSIKTFYWTTFGLSIVILPLNFGLGLVTIGLAIIPVLFLHSANGLRLSKIENHKTSIILSGVNLLIFALIRPDWVHAFTDSGLSSIFGIFGIHAGFSREYEDYFFYWIVVASVISSNYGRPIKEAIKSKLIKARWYYTAGAM